MAVCHVRPRMRGTAVVSRDWEMINCACASEAFRASDAARWHVDAAVNDDVTDTCQLMGGVKNLALNKRTPGPLHSWLS